MSDQALAAERGLEEKLATLGLDELRRPGGPDSAGEAEPEPVAEEAPAPELEPAPEPEPEAAPVADETGDPAIAAYLKKYDGDINKALQAGAQAQRRIGEMKTEVGQTREQNEELQRVVDEVAQLKDQLSQQRTQVPVDQATANWFDEQVIQNPMAAMEWARQQGNQILVQRGIQTWKELDPYGAARYENALDMQALRQELTTQRPSDESIEIQSALSEVLARHPEFVQYTDDLPALLEERPYDARGLSGSLQEKVAALQTLFELAERKTLRSLALANATDPAAPAEVAVPTVSEDRPEEEAPPPSGVDVFREQFADEAKRWSGERAVPAALQSRNYVAS